MSESDTLDPVLQRRMSRRKFLIRTGETLFAAVTLPACFRNGRNTDHPTFQDPGNPYNPQDYKNWPSPTKIENVNLNFDGTTVKATLGEVEALALGLSWAPDGHVPFIKASDGTYRAWISSGPDTYLLRGTDLKRLKADNRPVFGPSGRGFDANYAAPGSVITGNNPNELLMFYHGEYHPQAPNGFPFNAGVGLAISQDGGTTWQRKGQILEGKNNQPAKDRVFGAGQPTAIVKDGKIYLYYIDWSDKDPDSIHLATAPLSSGGVPGSWEIANKGKPVVSPPKGGDYSALPGVSWNSHLQKYLMIFEAKDGFYLTTSEDAVNWSDSQSLMKVQTANNNPKKGERWNSYPTLWSPNQVSDRETDASMLLVYSEGRWEQSPHHIVTRPVILS